MRILSDTERQWLFDRDALGYTPSRGAGISIQEELERRKTVISFVESLLFRATHDQTATTITASKNVLYTAAVLTHRFYMRRSLADFKEKLMAPTMLFLASKIEEEPLKLRYIVNTCLNKWVPGAALWEPDRGNKDQSREYQAWEREILAAEEMTLDALCFDMNVDQPRRILQQGFAAVTDIEGIKLEEVKGIAGLLLDYSKYTPLCVQYHPSVIAFAVFAISLALRRQTTLSEAFSTAAELGEKFSVDVHFTPEGMRGDEAEQVTAFCRDFQDYGEMGLIQAEMLQWVKPEIEGQVVYKRIFSSAAVDVPETNGHSETITASLTTPNQA